MSDFIEKYWQGKSVIITGASSGIGRAVAEALAKYQVHFGLLSRRLAPMQELAEQLKDSGSSFFIKSCDVRNREQVENAIQEFWQATGKLDIVWVNSGVSGRTSFSKWNWQDFENVIDTNLKGAVYTAIPALKIMVQQQSGAIVGIGSSSSMRGMPKHSAYSLSKIGLHFFFESLAAELPQIQFTIIHPGYVDTPLNQGRSGRIWLMRPERAARIMIKAVARRGKVVIYPLPMKIVYHVVRLLPEGMYRWLTRQAVKFGKVQ